MDKLSRAGADAEGLDAADRAVLSYASKLTAMPWKASADDLARLRELGFSDRAILEVTLATAYMCFVNRIAEGLGVELEGHLSEFIR